MAIVIAIYPLAADINKPNGSIAIMYTIYRSILSDDDSTIHLESNTNSFVWLRGMFITSK